ncbi:MAG: hypothetical protein RI909_2043 [Bacteroidota bacterium]|jgi:hypothetical protein
METHKRILAILYIISGALQIIGLLFVSLFMSFVIPFIMEEAGPDAEWVFVWLVPFIRIIAVVVILFFSVPSIIGGVGLLNNKSWALTLLLVLGCFKLFSFPIGTAIGIYTIYVYSENNKISSQAK